MKSVARRVLIGSGIVAIVGLSIFATTYFYALPKFISSNFLNKTLVEKASKQFGAELSYSGAELKTGKDLVFNLEDLSLKKGNKELLTLHHFHTAISYRQLFHKKILVKRLLAYKIYANASDLMALFPQEDKKEQKPCPISLDLYSTILGVKDCLITYSTSDFGINFNAKNVFWDRSKEKKYLHFDFDFAMSKGQDKIVVSASDMNKIYMGNGKVHIDKFPIEIDKSQIIISALASRKCGYNLNISSDNFKARDIYDILVSNLIIPNGKELLAPISDVTGTVDFNLQLSNKNIEGIIKVKESEFKVRDLMKMPVKITQGLIEIGNENIHLKDFKEYYNNLKENSILMNGEIKDYWKTCDTNIVSDIFVNDDFFKNYLTPMLGVPINLVGDADSRLTLTSKNGSLDIVWYFLLKENEGFKLGEQSMVLKDYKTLFKLDMSVVENILRINTIDYFITNELKKGMTPVLQFAGNLDMADNMKLLDMRLNIPRPLPSEFLNFLIAQKVFKGGTIFGDMSFDNNGEFPKMGGKIVFNKVRIPSQRLYLESAIIGAKGDKLGANAKGRYKRSSYDFKGYIVNDLRLPIVVKYVDLNIDNVDLEKLLATNVSQTSQSVEEQVAKHSDNEENMDIPTFTKGLVIVEKCMFNLKQGKYKSINFGNVHADLTLDKDGVLNVQSNKFDIAEGISTLKINADLIKKKYYLRLGVKDVDSNIMADAILGLPREISGKARGLVELNSDESLKLNGDIKFNIKDGTIEKIGYVEYILKVAALFRNPIVMITPTTFGDLVNIPDGKFDVINGELKLKDNVIRKISIKSKAPQLASFVAGRYDLETGDASLRIYTKMSNKGKGFAGALRTLSLNSLANKISVSGRNDSNYYASELEQIPQIEVDEKDLQVFLTKIEGDVANFNFLSSLRRIK